MNNLFSNVLRRSISRRVGTKRHYSTQPSKPNTTNTTGTTTSTGSNAASSSAKLSAKQIRRELLRGNKVTKIASVASVLTFAGATGYYLYGTVLWRYYQNIFDFYLLIELSILI